MVRSQAKAQRDALTPEERKLKSSFVCKRILEMEKFRQSEYLLVYNAIGSEVQMDSLIKESITMNKKVYYPKANSEDRSMEFYRVDDFRDFETGPYGIWEPRANEATRFFGKSGFVIVPGVGFDANRYRLGYGAGYYDRYLERFPQLIKVMAAFDCQQVKDTFPMDTDIKMDYVMTETKLL